MIKTNYPISQFRNVGYSGITRHYPINSAKFTLKVTQNEKVQNEKASDIVSTNVEDIISKLENGNKDAINVLESLGLNYSLTEYGKGYKIKFEQDGNKYTVAYNGEPVNTDTQSAVVDENVSDEESQVVENKTKTEEFNPPVPPRIQDYLKEITYSNGMREELVDDEAYEAAMQDYFTQKAAYDNKIHEHNQQVAEQQKQNTINNMQEEWDSFSQSIEELQTELDTNGTNSKMMTSVIHELSADYAKLIQRKKDEQLKNIDYVLQKVNTTTIPNPPKKASYETDKEYTEAMNLYTYQKFLYQKQQKELELKMQLSERRINKMDEKLAQIKSLLFGKTAT